MINNITRFILHRIPETIAAKILVTVKPLLSIPANTPEYVVMSLQGFNSVIKMSPRSDIGRRIYYCGRYESLLLNLLTTFVREEMGFIDIGANYGLYSVTLASKLKTGMIYAFEPQPDVYGHFRENIELNEIKNIQTFNCALAEKQGKIEIHYPAKNNDGAASLGILPDEMEYKQPVEVDVNVLSDMPMDYVKTHPYIVKIDVEGAEYSVLRGGKGLFEIKKPELILCECYDNYLRRFGHSDKDLFNLLKSYGYEVFALVGRFSPKFIQCDDYLQYKNGANRSSDILAILPGTKSYEKVNHHCIKL